LKPDALAGSRAPIPGGSSGFRLATAHERAGSVPSPCLVHRKRRPAPRRIASEFDKIHAMETRLLFTDDARVSGRTHSGKRVGGGAHISGAAS
jgi:hypothetical protein